VVRAPIVVSNADMLSTFERLLDRRWVDEHALARLKTLRPSYPCFLMHIGLHDFPRDVLREKQGYYWDGWDSDAVGTTALRFKLFVPTLYEPAMAPPGGHVLIVQKVQALEYDTVPDWRAHKSAVEHFVLTELEKLMPGIGRHMAVRLSATASTHQRYTMNRAGAMLGWEMAPDQLSDGRADVATRINGLYLAGHWTRPGGGITPVIVSAMETARRILENHECAFETRGPERGTQMEAVAS
jgi:prolycopene isomerase